MHRAISALALSLTLTAPAMAQDHAAHKKHGKPPVEGVLNVNRASTAELQLLPGIGRGRAEAIVERRSKHPFASLDEVAHIRGLKAIVRRLHAHLVVQGDTTLRPVRP